MASRADIHVHSKYSGLARLGMLRFPESVVEPVDIVKRAKGFGLDTVCVTDHNTIKGALAAKSYASQENGTGVVVGEEISAIEGEIIGLFLQEEVPRGLSAAETVDRIRAQDGIVVAPHPFSNHVPALGLLVDHLSIDGLEVFNAGHVDGFANHRALEHSQRGSWARLGGSDSHTLDTLGCGYTEFEGSGEEDFRKAILRKDTRAFGTRQPTLKAIKWTLEVVMEADRQILSSVFVRDYGNGEDDAVISKVKGLSGHKKFAALAASLVYFTPPIPYIAVLLGERKMRALNSVPLPPLSSVPVHDQNGNKPGLF